MTDRPIHVVLTAPYFGSLFQIAVLERFRKLMNPTQYSFQAVGGMLQKQNENLKRILLQAKPTLLIATSICPMPDVILAYRENNVPIILFDHEAPGASTIATDNEKGGDIATEHLISKGRTRIGIVNGRTQAFEGHAGHYCARLRLKGYEQALARHGLAAPSGSAIEAPDFSRADGIAALPKLVRAGVDAVFCAAADDCAMGLLLEAKKRGVRIPEDIAVVSFDDLPVAALATPALTTVRQPLEQMADAAYKMATVQLEEILKKPKKLLFEPKLIIRQSA